MGSAAWSTGARTWAISGVNARYERGGERGFESRQVHSKIFLPDPLRHMEAEQERPGAAF